MDPTQAINAAGSQPTLSGITQETPGEPGPITTEKKGPRRPRRKISADAGPHVAPGAGDPDMGERPRRKAAIHAEENMRRGTSKDPEAWPLLQARADRRRLLRRN